MLPLNLLFPCDLDPLAEVEYFEDGVTKFGMLLFTPESLLQGYVVKGLGIHSRKTGLPDTKVITDIKLIIK